jgi:transcriptional regulator with XRE-family HTH domain
MTLSEFLTDAELKPSVFAERLGVAPSTITRLLKRERKPGLDLAIRISDATGGKVTPQDILAEFSNDAGDALVEAAAAADGGEPTVSPCPSNPPIAALAAVHAEAG